MPIYTYKCGNCDAPFELMTSISEYKPEQPCPECESGVGTRTITEVSFILKGVGWPGRANRINNQMLKRREVVGKKHDEQKREGPKMTLAPNVGGERVDSWHDASKLAASKGLDASTYEPMVRKEKASD